MRSKLFRVSVVTGLFAIGLTFLATAESRAAKAAATSIEEIMEYNHSGKKSLTNKVKTAVKDGKWDEAAPSAKKMKDLASSLGGNPCPGGDAGSWKKLCESYAADCAAIAAAVEKKDAKAADAALGKLTKSCKPCHEAHR